MFFEANNQTLSIFSDIRHREGGPLSPGEGVYGLPFEAFRRAASGPVLPCEINGWKIVPNNKPYMALCHSR